MGAKVWTRNPSICLFCFFQYSCLINQGELPEKILGVDKLVCEPVPHHLKTAYTVRTYSAIAKMHQLQTNSNIFQCSLSCQGQELLHW
jgi:hypothetical protein